LLFIRRFFRSARLILAVVTIGLAQLLGGVASAIPGWIGHNRDPVVLYQSPLLHLHHQWGPIRFTGDYLAIAVLGVAALIGLGAFLRFTSMGIAVRGAAQNGDRASELGVNVRSLSTVVWVIAGLCAGLVGALNVPIVGFSRATAATPIAGGTLLVALAAGVIAGMDNLPLTVIAAIGIRVIQVTSSPSSSSATRWVVETSRLHRRGRRPRKSARSRSSSRGFPLFAMAFADCKWCSPWRFSGSPSSCPPARRTSAASCSSTASS
jgi:branched-subunit amino acid ABC-type transport system permease component